jgi:quercetin dioxygenase-like cupin family protein
MEHSKKDDEMEKSISYKITDIIGYLTNGIASKIILKKTTGNITVFSFDAGEEQTEKASPFDTYIHIIDGVAELNMNDRKYSLGMGEGIIIPAHTRNRMAANEQFKMISTMIKSGYEE